MKLNAKAQQVLNELQGEGPGALLARGGGGALFVRLIGMAIIFVNQVLLARFLHVENYGRYIYVITWLNLVSIVAVAGWDNAAVRFVAQYKTRSQWGLLRGIIWRSQQMVFLNATSFACLGAIVLGLLGDRLNRDLQIAFWYACLLLLPIAFLNVVGAIFRGTGHIAGSRWPEEILRPSLLAALVILCFLAGFRPVSATLTLAANLTATLVSLSILIGSVRAFSRGHLQNHNPVFEMESWWKVAVPLMFMAAVQVVLSQTDVIMLGFLSGTTEAGIYAVSCRLAALTYVPLEILNLAAAPLIASYFTAGEHNRLRRLTTVIVRVVAVTAVPLYVMLLVCGRILLQLFGGEFLSGYWPLVVLASACLVNALCGSVGLLLIMTGYERKAAAIMGTAALLNIIMNVVLIPLYGTVGAAISTAVSMVAWNLAMLYQVIRIHHINPSIFRSILLK
jgi:O-antigen/teichoic acid export membrane protein